MKLLLPISFILIAGLVFFIVVDPMYKDVSALRSDLALYNTALANSKNLQATRDKLVNSYKDIKDADTKRLDQFLPNTVNNIKFILEVEQIANMHNMPIKNIKFEPQRQQDPKDTKTTVVAVADPTASLPYGIFPIEFTTEGTYDSFVLFLKDLEHNLRLVDVKGVSFTVPTPVVGKPVVGAADPNIYTYSLKVETYWLK